MHTIKHICTVLSALAIVAQGAWCAVHAETADEQDCSKTLYTNGTLLFREDFGGNNPDDPVVSTKAVPGMSTGYEPASNTEYKGNNGDIKEGRYLITKQGYRNSSNPEYSCWHIMDDHTYFGDKTRGYLLEIDGKGSGIDTFYCTTLDGLCPGMELTFMAYVANLTTARQYDAWRKNRQYVFPRLQFVLSNPETGEVITSCKADTIAHDWGPSASDPAKLKSWQESAEWQAQGMKFTVPPGMTGVRLSIHNSASGSSTGNDFALDDIEVRLCMSVSLSGLNEVCEGASVTLTADSPEEEMLTDRAYKWWFSADSLAWEEIDGADAKTLNASAPGWYRAAIATGENIENPNCRAISDPFRLKTKECEDELCMEGELLFREDFGGNDPDDPIVGTQTVPGMDYTHYKQRTDANHVTGQPGLFWLIKSGYYHADTTGGKDPMKNHSNWYLQDDHTYPEDKTRGYLLEIDGLGGKAPFYSTVINDAQPGSILTFSAYVANVNKASNYLDGKHATVYPRLRFELTDEETGDLLAHRSTGDIPYDPDLTVNTDFLYSSKWYLHGMNFTVPPGVNSIRLTIYNDVASNGAGNDFALDDIEIRQCTPKVSIVSPDSVCPNEPYQFEIEINNEHLFEGPLEYQWMYKSPEYPGEWRKVSGGDVREPLISSFKTQHVGWYKLYVAGQGKIDNTDERIESEEYFVTFKKCEPDLCINGTLLFREDFGGNSPDDPRVGTEPVQGMSYRQLLTDKFGSMGSGRYLVAKEGYCNGDTAQYHGVNVPTWGSQWILQDDHTYPDDRSRGYFMEIDGNGDNTPFYSAAIRDLCPGTELTFSAYVVNVHFYEQVQKFFRQGRGYVYPQMKFILKNMKTGETLAEQSTGEIQPDVTKSWNIHLRQSAEWQLVGMKFTVPQEGVDSIQMFIYNNTRNGTGNDFAIDDIEIHACIPPVTLSGPEAVCENQTAQIKSHFENDGTLKTPLQYQWYFSPDSNAWDVMSSATTADYSIPKMSPEQEGWYRLSITGDGNKGYMNCGALSEPYRLSLRTEGCEPEQEELCMDGTLLFREDFGGNDPDDPRIGTTPVYGMSYEQLLTDEFRVMKAGKYLLTKTGYCNGDTTQANKPENRGSQWHLQDDHTYPGDPTRGYSLEIDGKGDHAAFYKTTIRDLCAGTRLTFSAYVANVMTWGLYVGQPGRYTYPNLQFTLTNPKTGEELASSETGEIPFDSAYINNYKAWQYPAEWRLVGMPFIVPDNIDSVTLTIYNNTSGTTGNDFALDDIEIRLCLPPVTIEGKEEVCETESVTLTGHFDYGGTITNPEYQWYFSKDSASVSYEEIDIARDPAYTIVNAQKADSGWYRLGVSEEGRMAYPNCRALSDPVLLKVKECEPVCPTLQTERIDTTVCDTLLPYTWRDTLFTQPATYDTIYKDSNGCDSLQRVLTLAIKTCYPEPLSVHIDTTVCDTEMPFTWHDHEFTEPGWFTYTGIGDKQYIIYTYSLATEPCDTCAPIIVNKYNWVLLVDNVRVRELFPGRSVTAYQWYKDGAPVAGATEDDYSERNELHGTFQMFLTLDGGEVVCSNTIKLLDTPETPVLTVKAYNSSGLLVRQWQTTDPAERPLLAPGIYLLRFESEKNTVTEKWMVP